MIHGFLAFFLIKQVNIGIELSFFILSWTVELPTCGKKINHIFAKLIITSFVYSIQRSRNIFQVVF